MRDQIERRDHWIKTAEELFGIIDLTQDFEITNLGPSGDGTQMFAMGDNRLLRTDTEFHMLDLFIAKLQEVRDNAKGLKHSHGLEMGL